MDERSTETSGGTQSIELSLVENKAQHLFTNHFTILQARTNQGLISARGTRKVGSGRHTILERLLIWVNVNETGVPFWAGKRRIKVEEGMVFDARIGLGSLVACRGEPELGSEVHTIR